MKKYVKMVLAFSILYSQIAGAICNDNMVESTPDERFEIQGAEVYDKLTKLTWKRCIESVNGVYFDAETSTCPGIALPHSKNSFTWREALEFADGTWRLPNIKELASIIETACYSPSINGKVFPNTPAQYFWSSSYSNLFSTGYGDVTSFISAIEFRYSSEFAAPETSTFYVRLVRN